MIEKIKTWAIIILTIALIVSFIVGIALLPGCILAPKRADYTVEDCFSHAMCLHQLKGAEDKSPCAVLGESCRDALKEDRNKKRMEYCRDNKFDKLSENECRLILNSK